MITVAKDNSGDFCSIQKAIDSITTLPETIYISEGIYEERIEIKKPFITLVGENPDTTKISYGYYALMKMDDGSNRGTFRSYTALFNADNLTIKNLTIENSSGFGTEVGQAIAVYAEGDRIEFSNCRLLGHQDTLFTGPLPLKEKQIGGFVGPTEFAPRKTGRQLYENCYICGEIDFIFGSATAYFVDCELFALNRNLEINAYYTAPSTYEEQKYGYVFEHCKFTGNCPQRTVMLSRPWRNDAKAVFLRCEMSEQIADIGYHDWNKPESHATSFYAEYDCSGNGYVPQKRASYIHQLTDEEALAYTKEKVLNILN